MERAYATSPTPTVNGDEADFRKYLDGGSNTLAVDLEKGTCIRNHTADGYLQVENLTRTLVMSNVEERKASEDKRYATFYLTLCIEKFLTHDIRIGFRCLPIVRGADMIVTHRASKDLDDPMNWPLGQRGEFIPR